MDPVVDICLSRANERPWGAFSNLYRRAFVFEGREFPTAEHAYQAGKPRLDPVREWILAAPSPCLVAMAAHGLYKWDIVSNWSKIKHGRMLNVLRAKFSQHDDLRELLCSTAPARLVETPRVDNAISRHWGMINGKGQNMLGALLMKVREELRQSAHGVNRADP